MSELQKDEGEGWGGEPAPDNGEPELDGLADWGADGEDDGDRGRDEHEDDEDGGGDWPRAASKWAGTGTVSNDDDDEWEPHGPHHVRLLAPVDEERD